MDIWPIDADAVDFICSQERAPVRLLQGLGIKMAGEKIVFFGNCQAAALAAVYSRHIGRPERQQVTHVSSFEHDDAGRSAMQEADIAVVQVQDFRSKVILDRARPGLWRVEFPTVAAGFLWPFGNQPHPRNASVHALRGPYPAQIGDAFLNKMIANGVPVDEAVECYLQVDVNAHVDLSRLFELYMDRQRRRDDRTGFNIADIIQGHFKNEQLFRSPDHPNLRIFRAVFSQLCNKLGISEPVVDRALDTLADSPFPATELPIHPSVIRHFGLTFVNETTWYRYFDEGAFTFAEYAARYMKFEYNADLMQGMALARSGAGNLSEAIAVLRRGLQKTPFSADGHHALSLLLSRQGEVEEAIASIRRAIRLDGQEPRFRVQLADLLIQRGDPAGAEAVLRETIDEGSATAEVYDKLCKALIRLDRSDDATVAMRIAVQLDGSNPHGRAYFAGLLVSRGELAEAEPHIRAAIERDPGVWVFHLILGMLLVAKGDADQAINALQTAARLNPSHPGVHYQLAHHLFKQGHFAEAATALQRVIDLDGRNAQAFAQMGHLRFRLGQLDDAERCLRHAISLDSNVAMYHLALGHTLFHLDRGNEALKSARQAAVLAPDDPACKRFVDFVTTRTVPFIPMETDRHVIAKRQFETEFVMETIETQASNAVVTLEQDEPKHETKSRGGTSLWLKLLNVGRHGTLLADGRSR